MAKKFLDQNGLQYVIEQLNIKYRKEFVASADFGAAKVGYAHDKMSGVADVAAALDVIVANIVRQEGQLTEAAGNMIALEQLVAAAQKAADDEATRAKAEEADIRADFAAADTALQTAVDAKVAQADYDAKMDALDAEDERIAGLVATEKGRAEGVEAAIRQELANEKATLQGEIADAKSLLQGEIDEVEKDVQALEQKVGDFTGAGLDQAIKDEAQARANADTGLDNRLKVVEAAIGEDGALEARVAANEDAIEVINGTGEGSIKKAIADLVDGAPEATNTLNELAQAIKDNKDVYDGWVAAHEQAMAQMKSELQGEIDSDVKVEADRAKGEEARIEGLVNTEKSRAEGVEAGFESRLDVIEGEATVTGSIKKAQADAEAKAAQLDATLKSELQAEIDADVKVVADDLAALEEVVGKEADGEAEATGIFAKLDDIKETVENNFADANEELVEGINESIQQVKGDLQKEIADAQAAAEGKAALAQADADALEKRLDDKGGLVDRLEAAEAFVAAQPAIDSAQDDRIKALEDANKEGGAVKEAIDAVAQDLADFEGEQATKEAAQDDAIQDVADELTKQKDAAQEGTLAKKIADEAAARETADNGLAARIAVFEANGAQDVAAKEVRLAALEAKFGEGDDTVAKQIADAVAAEAALREAGDALKVDITAFDEFKGTNTQAIKDAVKVETDRAVEAEGAIRDEFAAADDVVRGEFAAADAQIKLDYAAADAEVLASAKEYADAATEALVEADIDEAFKAVFGE